MDATIPYGPLEHTLGMLVGGYAQGLLGVVISWVPVTVIALLIWGIRRVLRRPAIGPGALLTEALVVLFFGGFLFATGLGVVFRWDERVVGLCLCIAAWPAAVWFFRLDRLGLGGTAPKRPTPGPTTPKGTP